MPGDFETLKEYLVALGFSVDQTQYNKFKNTLDSLDKLVEKHTDGMARNYAKAGFAVVGALTSITGAVVGLMDKIAMADLGYQKFALRMYMNADAAKQLKIATDALGESIQDIAWMPELRQRYFSLLGDQRRMALPGDFESQMRYLRDIRFEFTRMKMEATYSLQWIGSYLFRYLAEPITGIKGGLKGLNDYIIEKMPEWTNKVAQWLTQIINLGASAWRALKDIAHGFKMIWDILPPLGKELVLLGGIVTAIFMAGPFGRAFLLLSGILLLLDDFYAYLDGRKSSKTLAPIWNILLEMLDKVGKAAETAAVSVAYLNTITWRGTTKEASDAFNARIKEIWTRGSIAAQPRQEYLKEKAPGGVYSDLLSGGFGKNAAYASRVMMAESTGRPSVTNYNKNNGTTDYGLFQINSVHIPELMKAGIIGGAADLFDPTKNVAAATYLQKQYGWSPWKSSLGRLSSDYEAGPYLSPASASKTVQINVGDINIPINQPAASPEDIVRATRIGVMEALDQATQRHLSEQGGIYK